MGMASLRTLMTSGLLLKEETASVPCGSGRPRRVSCERVVAAPLAPSSPVTIAPSCSLSCARSRTYPDDELHLVMDS